VAQAFQPVGLWHRLSSLCLGRPTGSPLRCVGRVAKTPRGQRARRVVPLQPLGPPTSQVPIGGTSMRKPGTAARRGAWALARFLHRNQLSGEREKNALAGSQLQLLVPKLRMPSALRSLDKAFFSFSPAFGTHGAQKRAKAHIPGLLQDDARVSFIVSRRSSSQSRWHRLSKLCLGRPTGSPLRCVGRVAKTPRRQRARRVVPLQPLVPPTSQVPVGGTGFPACASGDPPGRPYDLWDAGQRRRVWGGGVVGARRCLARLGGHLWGAGRRRNSRTSCFLILRARRSFRTGTVWPVSASTTT